MTAKALDAADLLTHDGIAARVINVSTIKPLDVQNVLDNVKNVERVFTVEEHSIIGGLGSAVAEVMAGKPGAPLTRLGTQDVFGESGVADELLEKHGLQGPGIYKSVIGTLKARKK
jgi:transketolase